MSIFGSIKNAIFGTAQAAEPAAAPAEAAAAGGAWWQTAAAAAPVVDVDVVLTEKAGSSGLNWQNSIVDLMKVVGIDSSLDNRKELATELGYTGALDGSAEIDLWLHKEVLRHIAANGGSVPASLTD